MSKAIGAAKQVYKSSSSIGRVLSGSLASTTDRVTYTEELREKNANAAQEKCSDTLPSGASESYLLMGRGDIRTKRGKVRIIIAL